MKTRKKPKTYEHTISETKFLARVVQLARLNGFRIPRENPLEEPLDLIYHPWNSQRSTPGYPDLTLVHPERLVIIFAELKSESGRVKPEQKLWKEVLQRVEDASGGRVLYRLWRPSDWPEIVRDLGEKDVKLFV